MKTRKKILGDEKCREILAALGGLSSALSAQSRALRNKMTKYSVSPPPQCRPGHCTDANCECLQWARATQQCHTFREVLRTTGHQRYHHSEVVVWAHLTQASIPKSSLLPKDITAYPAVSAMCNPALPRACPRHAAIVDLIHLQGSSLGLKILQLDSEGEDMPLSCLVEPLWDGSPHDPGLCLPSTHWVQPGTVRAVLLGPARPGSQHSGQAWKLGEADWAAALWAAGVSFGHGC
ncbi:hypothetical protein TREES_T100007902 [Tupaia chinensis]|uniref:Uncharacterized protein n=1 Tax=Tupaia chinensis TaxID=246437 RepID=L9JDS1_TUPCH|nr:hypothetical protein TREES_T100007902 [Tupaia chinensis]